VIPCLMVGSPHANGLSLHGGRPFSLVRPAWAVVRGWKSPRDLVAGTEVNRKAVFREDGAEGSGVAKS
jgi:transketolase C-terminal domain/subunit